MEAVEHTGAPTAALNNNDLTPIAKGKRTKRHRTHSPTHFTTRPPSVPALANNPHVPTSPASASSSAGNSTTTEEEDTARCLILLAQGHFPSNNRTSHDYQYRQVSDRKAYSQTTGNAGTTKIAGGAHVYTCKTCNRSFSSFQALGGHRASHKKPKNEKRSAFFSDEEDFPSPSSLSSFKNKISPNSLSLQLNISNTNFSGIPKSAAPSPRIHECSYCGAEFNSGQALGGHMRRHRGGPISPPVIATPTAASPRNGLSLDLNLPAPEDEHPRFGLPGPRPQHKSPEKRKPIEAAGERVNVLPTSSSAPSMVVDCQY